MMKIARKGDVIRQMLDDTAFFIANIQMGHCLSALTDKMLQEEVICMG